MKAGSSKFNLILLMLHLPVASTEGSDDKDVTTDFLKLL